MTALAPEFDASVPTERLRQRIDAAVLDSRIGTASSRERAGFGAFISSLLSFGTQRTLGYASLVAVLAFAAIFGLGKFKTAPEEFVAETQPAKTADEQVAVAPAPVEPVQVNGSQPVDSPVDSKPVKSQRVRSQPVKSQLAKSAPVRSEAVKSEPVKLLPGERSYLQTIARLDSTIKANQMRPSLQVEYARNLAVVDRAIAATRSAAKSNPNDPDAADFMFAAYQSKVDLLNTIADARLGGGRSQ